MHSRPFGHNTLGGRLCTTTNFVLLPVPLGGTFLLVRNYTRNRSPDRRAVLQCFWLWFELLRTRHRPLSEFNDPDQPSKPESLKKGERLLTSYVHLSTVALLPPPTAKHRG